MELRTIGILSTGEMGTSIARVLAANGLEPITTLEGRSRTTKDNADAAGVEDVGSDEELVRRADLILSVVPSGAVFDVARSVAEAADSTGDRVAFAEMNAVAPSTVIDIADEFGADLDVIDGCIIGPASDLSKARFYFSGSRAEDGAGLGEYGLDTDVLGAEVGQASGLKLCFAGMTKGTNAVALDLLMSARALDIEGPLRGVYERRLPGILEYVDYFLPGSPKRAGRRAQEMEELSTMFEALDIGDAIPEANHDRLTWLASLGLDTDDAADATETARRVYDASRE